MTDVPPLDCLKLMINLKNLNLSYNLIKNFNTRSFSEKSNIIYLDLSHNKIEVLDDI